MSYSVKEIFYSLQGEGAQAGRPALFCRFAGCNLWSGRAQDRDQALCKFCDTNFRGLDGPQGGRFPDAARLAERIFALWPSAATPPYVVCTGGEPLLQLDAALINALHARGCEIAVETNGTLRVPAGIDWLCVSPKAGAALRATGRPVVRRGSSDLAVESADDTPSLLPSSISAWRIHLRSVSAFIPRRFDTL